MSSFIAPHFSPFFPGKQIPVRLWWRGTGKIMHHINSARLARGVVKGVASPFSCITSRSLRKVGNTFCRGESLVYLNTYDIYIYKYLKHVDPCGYTLKNLYQRIHHSNVDLCFTTAPKTVILLNLIEIYYSPTFGCTKVEPNHQTKNLDAPRDLTSKRSWSSIYSQLSHTFSFHNGNGFSNKLPETLGNVLSQRWVWKGKTAFWRSKNSNQLWPQGVWFGIVK